MKELENLVCPVFNLLFCENLESVCTERFCVCKAQALYWSNNRDLQQSVEMRGTVDGDQNDTGVMDRN